MDKEIRAFMRASLVEYLKFCAPATFPCGFVQLKGGKEIVEAELMPDGSAVLIDRRGRNASDLVFHGRYQIVNDDAGKAIEIIVFRPDTPNADDEEAWLYRIANMADAA